MIGVVTLVTRDASLDDLSVADYRDIYDELRARDAAAGTYGVSLDKFVTLVTSAYSKAQWSKYHNGETALTRTMRNELRRAVGLPLLPPTVADATAAASPDAAVWQVGIGPAEHVIMVASPEPLTLHVNGAVSAASDAAAMPCLPAVTPVTQARRRARKAPRPFVSKWQEARQKCLYSQGIRASWRDIIDAGLSALEARRNDGANERRA